MKQALILFTRVPIAGKTKTRLQTALTPEQCAQVHSAFLQDVASSCLSPLQWDLLMFYGEEGPLSVLQGLLPQQKDFFLQQGKTLGEKMDRAITDTFKMGYNRCVLIGADLPLINREIIAQAMRVLEETSLVLGPTVDVG